MVSRDPLFETINFRFHYLYILLFSTVHHFLLSFKNITCMQYLSHNMGFPTMWYVPPAKAQTSLRIRAI